jgi:hypothetical protein
MERRRTGYQQRHAARAKATCRKYRHVSIARTVARNRPLEERILIMPAEKLLHCPFCGELPEVAKHFREDVYRLIHRCKIAGPIVLEWASKGANEAQWNRRAYIKEARPTVRRVRPCNSESVKLPSETLLLLKCAFFETCPVSGRGHAGCYSEAPCFKR